jgi:hypothetical protein
VSGDFREDIANGIVCEAIEKKRLLQISYDDLTRIIEFYPFGQKGIGQ